MTREELKNEIDQRITNKTAVYSITPQDVGVSIKLVVDNGYNKDEGFGALTEVSTANRVMVLDANGRPFQISTSNLSDILAVKGDSMSPVEPGPLPDGPAGVRRVMRVKAGTYTYGINKTYEVPVGQEGSLVWDGTTWEEEYYLFPVGLYPIASISVNGEPVPIDAQKNVNIEIPDAPVQSIEVNGVVVDPDAAGKVSIIIPDAPVQSVSVNGVEVLPDGNGNIAITIPNAPVQGVEVNGEAVPPDPNGIVRIQIPDAPVQGITVNNGQQVPPDSNGIIHLTIPEAPIQGIRVNGDLINPDGTGTVDIELNNIVEQTVDRNSSNAVSAAAVGAEIDGLTANFATAIQLNESGEEDEKVYSLSLLDGEGNVLSTSAEFSGGGGGGGEVATTKIILTKITENPTIKEGDPLTLQYYYDHQNTSDNSSTGTPARATITVTSGATTRTILRDINADTINSIDVSNLLLVGYNTVRVRVEVDNGDGRIQTLSVSWRVQVVTLRLSSSFNFATLYNIGQAVTVPYNLSGSGNKTLRLYVDGVQREERLITTSSSNGSFTVQTTGMSHGSHSIQMVAELEATPGNILKSNSIYFDVAVRNTASQVPIIATRFDYNDGTIIGTGQRPYVEARKFENFAIQYAGYNPAAAQNQIDVIVAGSTIASVTAPFAQRAVTHRMTTDGTYSGQIKLNSVTYTFGVEVADSQVDLDEPTDNLLLKLAALGRSNSDSDRTTWNYNGITTTITGVQYAGDGWVNNALRLINNGKAVINFKPLSTENKLIDNAWAFNIKFKISDVTNFATPLIHCMVGGVGFTINAETVRFRTAGGAETEMQFAAGDEYNCTFVSMPSATANSSDYEKLHTDMIYLYINGARVGGAQREAGDNIYQSPNPASITLEGNGSTLDVYSIRCYNNYLTADQALALYMIDLPTVEQILAKYEFNNIIDAEGDITVESLPEGTRYMIITGQAANGMSTVDYAAAMNNKDDRYDIQEVLHIIKGDDKRLNFRYVGGCIRLQGTSSLAYPRKNYRVYFRNAGKQYGTLYVGVDAQGNGGTINPANLFSFKLVNPNTGKIPYPVNLWCLKADFAESSSSHNTGMARLANDTLQKVGDKTPAQRDVLASHPYDVRTTVDGDPCYLFERKTVGDKPVFKGKFNMNNDKATEQVFGFLDIPGYHVQADGVTPMAWVTSQFGGENPTECWEFLNNDFPMGMYLDDNFDATNEDGSPAWNKVFEARFPDNQGDYDDGTLGKPYHLERWVKWVKSTQGNPTKFRNELPLYADVRHLCSYFVLTQWFAMVDQMVKNAMLCFYYDPVSQRMLAYYIFYDNDTILGLRNDGRLKYKWDVDRNTLDPELTAAAGKNIYAFMGHDSILWNNLEAAFATEIGEAYTRLRQALSNDDIYQVFDEEQVGAFPERVYNIDADYKYIEPKTLGVDVIINGNIVNSKYSHLEAMQGPRSSQRKWFITNRSDFFDAKYSAGQYRLTDITWKGISDAGAQVSAELSRDYYVEFRREAAIMDRKFVDVSVNPVHTYTYNQTANVGTIFHYYGGKFFKKLNMATWGGFTDLTLPNLVNLEELILGMTGRTYTLSELVIGTKFPMLKVLDITNYTVLPSLNLEGCLKLQTLRARGTTSLGTIRFPEGAPLTTAVLGTGLNTLRLVGLPFLTNAGITFPDGNNVQNLVVEACPLINWRTLMTTLGGVQNIRITGINETGPASILEQYKNLGGIDANGNVVTGARLVGTYRLSTYIEDSLYNEYRIAYPELTIIQAEYSVVRVYEKATDGSPASTTKKLYNPDNNTGYGTANPYVVSGHFKKLLTRHRYLGKQGTRGTMTIFQLHDKNSAKFNDNVNPEAASEALLEGQQGDVWVREPAYWYKGVNDFLNGVIYVGISSNAAKPALPSASTTKLVTKAQLVAGGLITSNRYVRRGFPNVDSAINTNPSGMSVIKLDVAGYNKINFTFATYGTGANAQDICSAFTREDGTILTEIRASDTEYTTGADYIVNRPADAKWLYISIYTDFVDNIDFSFVLSNSTNPMDWNYDWHYSPSMLVSPFETSWSNNKFRSIQTYQAPPEMSEVVLRSNLENRNFSMLTYQIDKSIKNFYFWKYGDTDYLTKIGVPRNRSFNLSGTTVPYGIQDTETNGLDVITRFRTGDGVGGATYVEAERENFLGYENLVTPDTNQGVPSDTFFRLAPRVTINGQPIARFTIEGYPGAYYMGNVAGDYMKRLVWSKTLDRLPMGNGGSSELTDYTDTFDLANGGEQYQSRGNGRTAPGNGAFAMKMTNTSPQLRWVRLVFTGNIVESTNLTTFKSIVEAV